MIELLILVILILLFIFLPPPYFLGLLGVGFLSFMVMMLRSAKRARQVAEDSQAENSQSIKEKPHED